jgi:uncharacterized protein (TIGR02145 family)
LSVLNSGSKPDSLGKDPTIGKDVRTDLLIIDADSNVYHTVTIGTQIWLVENLRTTRYLNGDPIPSDLNASQWTDSKSGACKIGSDIYGNLYNAYAVADSRKICPAGWHVPTIYEWDILLNYLGNEPVAGGPLKEAGTTHWLEPNVGATNLSGFTALPAGLYHPPYGNEEVQSVGMNAVWWSSTKELNWFWTVQCSFASTDAVATEWDLYDGLSVRCISGNTDSLPVVSDKAPIVMTEPATNISATGATLNGTVNANDLSAIVIFEYDNSEGYGQQITAEQSPVTGNTSAIVSAKLTGLTKGTYHFRITAENSSGKRFGSGLEFKL